MPDQAKDALDTVMGYFGMRKVSLGRTSPNAGLRIFLNDQPLTQFGFLDQACVKFDRVLGLFSRACYRIVNEHIE